MNIACSTTAFTKVSLEEALGRIHRLGFRHVDLLAMEGWAHLNPSEIALDPDGLARRVKRLLKQHDLRLVALNASFSLRLNASEPELVRIIEKEASALMRFARNLSVPVVVLPPGQPLDGQNEEQAFGAAVSTLTKILDIALQDRVTVALETHSGSLAETYRSALRFVAEVPDVKLAYDPSHFIMSGQKLQESAALLPYTAHVHLRNAVAGNFQAPMASGSLDFMWVFEAIDAARYGGAISIEYLDGRPENVLQEVEALGALLKARYGHV